MSHVKVVKQVTVTMDNYYIITAAMPEDHDNCYTTDTTATVEQDTYYTLTAGPAEHYGNAQPYSVARYETTSGPWHNILDVPGAEVWQGDPVYGTENSAQDSAVASQGSVENLPQPENRDKRGKNKKKDKKDGKGDKADHKKEDGHCSKHEKKEKKAQSGGNGVEKGRHSHKTHAGSAH